jgi:hypothetical protein
MAATRSGSGRRRKPPAILAALATVVVALLLAVYWWHGSAGGASQTTAASTAQGGAPGGAATSSRCVTTSCPANTVASPTAESTGPLIYGVFGTPITDPSATPLIEVRAHSTVGTGHPAFYDLPTAWDPSAWYAQVAAFTGVSSVTKQQTQQGAYYASTKYWTKTVSTTQSESLGVSISAAGHPESIGCESLGYDPGSASGAAEITQFLVTCAGAQIPGGDAAAAVSWVRSEAADVIKDLVSMPDTDYLAIPMPTFGSERIEMTAGQTSYYGEVVNLNVYGSVPQS